MARPISEDERRVAVETLRELVARLERRTIELASGQEAVTLEDVRAIVADAIASLELGR